MGRSHRIILLLFVAAIAVLAVSDAEAMTIRTFSSTRHPRSSNPSFIGAAYDWSGVSTTDSRVAMVSPSYFISATHYHPSSGSVTFTTPGGSSVVRTISGGSGVSGTDIWVGQISSPVPSTINYYPVLDLGSNSAHLGRELYNYGHGSDYGYSDIVGRNILDTIGTVSGTSGISMLYTYDDPGVGDDETFLQGGDSGRPSFTVANGRLAFMGPHYFIWSSGSTVGSADSFVPNYISEINALMGTESLTLIPEPSSLLLLGLGAGLLVGWARRRRRAA